MLTKILLKKNKFYIASIKNINKRPQLESLVDRLSNNSEIKFYVFNGQKNFFIMNFTNFYLKKDVYHAFSAHNNLDYLYEVVLRNESWKMLANNVDIKAWHPFCMIPISDIKKLKLLWSEDDFNHSYPQKGKFGHKRYVLKDEEYKVLSYYMQGHGRKHELQKIISPLSIKHQKEIKLFKGIDLYDNKKHDLFSNVKLNFEYANSWTVNLAVAEDFGSTIVSYTAKPEDIIIDTRLIYRKQLERLYQAKQKEIILKPGTYNCKIIHT